MKQSLKDVLNQIKTKANNHKASPDDLIHSVQKVCRSQFNIHNFDGQFGLISHRDALELLGNNVTAAVRQHDLAEAEAYREQKSRITEMHTYYTETIHGCHTAPTVSPVTYSDVIDIIKAIGSKNQ